jgi:hypothetical protein
MKRTSTLSDYVQDYSDTLHHDVPPEELAESKQTRKMFEVIVRDLISSRETLTDGKLREAPRNQRRPCPDLGEVG